MKLRYLFSTILASAFVFAGCEKNVPENFDNIQLDKTFVSIKTTGGSADLTITATEDWKFVIDENWPEAVSFIDSDIKAEHDVFGNLTNDAADIKSKKETWLKASVLSGKAGKTTVTFSAEKFDGGREFQLAIVCGSNKQHFIVRQGSLEAVTLTCKEIHDKASVGASYRTRGVVTQLGNYASYGAFWINDGTTEKDVQVYGSTSDSREAYPDIAVGDSVTFVGTWSSYKNFENVEIVKHVKSLVKIATDSKTLSKEGGEFDVKVAYKGVGVLASVPEEYRSWVSVVDMRNLKGTPTKIEPNPADTAIVTISVLPNADTQRTASVVFSSQSGKASSSMTYDFTQEGTVVVDNPYASNVAFIVGTSSYIDGVATVNGIENVATLKLGTASKVGTGTVVLPKGIKTVSFYAVAWKGSKDVVTLLFKVGETSVGTQEIAANDGATGNAPYTITVTDTDKYTLTLDSPLAAETEVAVTTTAVGRAIIFGVNAK